MTDSSRTRREVLKAGAVTLAAGVPLAVVASAEVPLIAVADNDQPAIAAMWSSNEMHEFTFHFLVTGDRGTARKVMDHFQSFIETSDGWPARQTGINTSKIVRV